MRALLNKPQISKYVMVAMGYVEIADQNWSVF
jgi:hypothetical protein